MKVNIKCDVCNWRLEDQSIWDWKNKSCPQCEESNVINLGDVLFYFGILLIYWISKPMPKSWKSNITVDSTSTHRKFKDE